MGAWLSGLNVHTGLKFAFIESLDVADVVHGDILTGHGWV